MDSNKHSRDFDQKPEPSPSPERLAIPSARNTVDVIEPPSQSLKQTEKKDEEGGGFGAYFVGGSADDTTSPG
jgi:hypothetical protein